MNRIHSKWSPSTFYYRNIFWIFYHCRKDISYCYFHNSWLVTLWSRSIETRVTSIISITGSIKYRDLAKGASNVAFTTAYRASLFVFDKLHLVGPFGMNEAAGGRSS